MRGNSSVKVGEDCTTSMQIQYLVKLKIKYREKSMLHFPLLPIIQAAIIFSLSNLKVDSCVLEQMSCRFIATDGWSWRVTSLAFPMRISNTLCCPPFLVNETTGYLNLSDWFSESRLAN